MDLKGYTTSNQHVCICYCLCLAASYFALADKPVFCVDELSPIVVDDNVFQPTFFELEFAVFRDDEEEVLVLPILCDDPPPPPLPGDDDPPLPRNRV
mmetsp:Transcript_5858/g.7241  ORF Transcript_5858/g.7241 Transcript_5858/m.7241 type:complete len:97 (+) Transcript_5858:109-399(+)